MHSVSPWLVPEPGMEPGRSQSCKLPRKARSQGSSSPQGWILLSSPDLVCMVSLSLLQPRAARAPSTPGEGAPAPAPPTPSCTGCVVTHYGGFATHPQPPPLLFWVTLTLCLTSASCTLIPWARGVCGQDHGSLMASGSPDLFQFKHCGVKVFPPLWPLELNI